MTDLSPNDACVEDVQAENPGEEMRLRELSENNALARALDEVRAQSRRAQLMTPARFDELSLVPDHMTSEDFEMYVYAFLEEHLPQKAEAPVEATVQASAKKQPAPHVVSRFRTAKTTAGVPTWFDKKPAESTGPDPAEQVESEPEYVGPPGSGVGKRWDPLEGVLRANPKPAKKERSYNPDDEVFGTLQVPEGYKLVRLDGEIVLVPKEGEDPKETKLDVDYEHIKVLTGKYTYYLYDNELITDAYAHLCFLAAEDDDEFTFAELVREESRIYPRPMNIKGFQNEPYNKTADEIEALWTQMHASGGYPDLERTKASNGDVYFYSTKYLAGDYAESLAEWNSVGRRMSV